MKRWRRGKGYGFWCAVLVVGACSGKVIQEPGEDDAAAGTLSSGGKGQTSTPHGGRPAVPPSGGAADDAPGIGGAPPQAGSLNTGGELLSCAAGGDPSSAGEGGAWMCADTAPPADDEPHWRDHTGERFLSAPWQGLTHHNVGLWSDDVGVYIAVGQYIEENRGKGWSHLSSDAGGGRGRGGLSGFPGGGPLVRYNEEPDCCGISFIDRESGAARCRYPGGVSSLFVVDESLVYAVQRSELLRFDGTSFEPDSLLIENTQATDIQHIWASRTEVVALSEQQVYIVRGDSGFVPQLSTDARFTAVWGLADDDVWVADSAGRLSHLSGGKWTPGPTHLPPGNCGPDVRQLWGTKDRLWVMGADRLSYVNDDVVEPLILGDCEQHSRTWSVWGSGSDVFVAYQVPDTLSACGNIAAFWWNGAQFRPL